MANRIMRRARIEKGYQKPPVAGKMMFYGWSTPGLSDDEIEKSIIRFIEYGLPLYAGGQMEQPAQWWDDVEMYNAIYNFGANDAAKKKELEDKRKNARSR